MNKYLLKLIETIAHNETAISYLGQCKSTAMIATLKHHKTGLWYVLINVQKEKK